MQGTQLGNSSGIRVGDTALRSAIIKARRRIAINRTLRLTGRALCFTSLPCALAVVAGKLRWIEQPPPAFMAGLMGGAALTALIVSLSRKVSDIDIARLTDQRSNLKERISSALEFQNMGVAADAPFYQEQFADAEHYAGSIDMKTAFPIKLPWEAPVGLLCALAVFLTFLLPTIPLFWSKQHKDEVAAIKKRGIEIEKVARDAEKAADQQKLDETKKVAAEARKLGEEMHKGKIDKKQSLVALSKLTHKIEEAQKRMAEPVAKKSLADAHKDFQKALDKVNQEKQAEQKKAEEMKKLAAQGKQPQRDMQKPDPGQSQKESEAMREAKQAMQQMSDALANQDHQQMKEAMQKLADQMKKGEMSKEELKQLQQEMKSLAQSLKDTNQQKAAEMMQQASEMMQNGQMSSQSMQQVASMMNQAGKMMGEGQNKSMMMDSKALGELAQMLKDGRLTKPLGQGNGQGGSQPGPGFNGHGGPSTAMKDPGATTPILVAKGTPLASGGKGKEGSAAEFAKYLASSGSSAPKRLPNGKIAGVRSQNGNEMQMTMTGDPQAARSTSPYYQVVQTSKKQAENTLDKENIPASLKKQVKDYFDSIR
jgi:hypothetical protein